MDALTDTALELTTPVPPKIVERGRGRRRFFRFREGVSTYLPLLLMVLLALATWWLVKNAPVAAVPVAVRPVTHEADYIMQGALLQRFDAQGRLRVQVQGDRLRHFPDTDKIEVDAVRIRSYANDGSVLVATAKKAVTNNDASEVELLGSAQVQREAATNVEPVRFDSEFLRLRVDSKRIESHLPVVFQSGANTVRAGGFDYDENTQIANLKGPVKVTAFPAGRAPQKTQAPP